ncbi:MAG: hypothetical protein FWC62_05835 [Firmicutes bacterium]|nr:hypothetical protein [Bacillota bacterium]
MIDEAQTQKSKTAFWDITAIALMMLAVYFVAWMFTGIWPLAHNSYNLYSLQAARWLSGHLDLGQNDSWLEIAQYGGRYYASFPPFPSFVLTPFVLIFGVNTPDHLITVAAGIAGAAYVYKLARLTRVSRAWSVFFALFATVGGNFLFVGFNGGVWFIAQTFSFTLCAASLYYAMTDTRSHGYVSLFLWACAVGCRPFQAVYLPILLYLLYRKAQRLSPGLGIWRLLVKYLVWAAPAVFMAAVYMLLNYFRFGNPLEFGHDYLPEFTGSAQGQFSFSYVLGNIKNLLRLPSIDPNSGRFVFPLFGWLAFWLVNPIFMIYAVFGVYACVKKYCMDRFVMIVTPLLILVNFFLLTLHKTMGGWQWGNRYTIDAIPFMMLALFAAFQDREVKIGLKLAAESLFFFGLCLNLVGTIAVYNNWIHQ